MAVPRGQSDSYCLGEGLQRLCWSALWEGTVIRIKSRVVFKGVRTLKNGVVSPEWGFWLWLNWSCWIFWLLYHGGEGSIFSDVGESEWLISQAGYRQCAVQDCTMENLSPQSSFCPAFLPCSLFSISAHQPSSSRPPIHVSLTCQILWRTSRGFFKLSFADRWTFLAFVKFSNQREVGNRTGLLILQIWLPPPQGPPKILFKNCFPLDWQKNRARNLTLIHGEMSWGWFRRSFSFLYLGKWLTLDGLPLSPYEVSWIWVWKIILMFFYYLEDS